MGNRVTYLPPNQSGIIGSDVMKRYELIIDYADKKVGILTSKKVIEDGNMLFAAKSKK